MPTLTEPTTHTGTTPTRVPDGHRRGLCRLWQEDLREESGQAMVEFAIVVTVFLLLVVGILYFGRFLNYTIDQTHLANIAARYASVNEDPACTNNDPTQTCSMSLAKYIQSQADGELLGGSSNVTVAQVCIIQPPGASQAQGSPVEAQVKSTFGAIPFFGGLSLPVTETAYIMLEDNPAPQNIYGCSS
jgi:Flp pilus assembly protein TadG